jgi:hypothetical protein
MTFDLFTWQGRDTNVLLMEVRSLKEVRDLVISAPTEQGLMQPTPGELSRF